eukprot:scaffold7377_cov257-Pinguiococcus_pyrenoidosus.AAC.15
MQRVPQHVGPGYKREQEPVLFPQLLAPRDEPACVALRNSAQAEQRTSAKRESGSPSRSGAPAQRLEPRLAQPEQEAAVDAEDKLVARKLQHLKAMRAHRAAVPTQVERENGAQVKRSIPIPFCCDPYGIMRSLNIECARKKDLVRRPNQSSVMSAPCLRRAIVRQVFREES